VGRLGPQLSRRSSCRRLWGNRGGTAGFCKRCSIAIAEMELGYSGNNLRKHAGMFKCSASAARPFISVGKCCSALRGTARGRQGVAEPMSTSTGDITIQLASARRALNARAARKLSKKRHGNCRKAGLSFQSGLSCR
jgi:hypothetical protein